MLNKSSFFPVLIAAVMLGPAALAQPDTTQAKALTDNYGAGLKINIDQSGSKYLRFLFMNQVWVRSNQNNPNTMVNGEAKDNTFDIGLRRSRLIFYAQISDRFLILTHFGINNQSFSSGGASGSSGTGGYGAGKKPGLFIHDAYAEYAIIPEVDKLKNKKNDFSLYFGAGIHLFNGVSRITSASTLNMMTLDAPIVNWALIDNSDQFARQMGMYIKGNFKKFSYNFSLNKPFATNLLPVYDSLMGSVAVDNNGDSKPAIQGYVDYQFFDKESNFLGYRVGTYLGAKKVLNVGAGFYHNSDGTKSMSSAGTLEKHDINMFGADVYGDMPVGDPAKKAAISFYGAYYNYNFGPNYNRSLGIMNVAGGLNPAASTPSSISGAGNSRLMFGTGQMIYTHLGYLLPKWSNNQKVRIMPYVANTYKALEVTSQNSNSWDIGSNFFLNGHNAKITAQYSHRPLYFRENNEYVVSDSKGEFIVQFHVFL